LGAWLAHLVHVDEKEASLSKMRLVCGQDHDSNRRRSVREMIFSRFDF